MQEEGTFFRDALVYLSAAVVSVPLAKRLGLGSVLGYLLAGVAIGPAVLGLLGDDTHDVMHFAEFGVVMMLFLIGLELRPSLLWRLRGPIFGLGGAQVLVTAAAVGAVLIGFVQHWQQALAVGFIVAMSSTAIALQTLKEKGLSNTHGGKRAFAILLFQDIAVIPMLALFPMLATVQGTHAEAVKGPLSSLPGWLQIIATLGSVVLIIFIGRYLSSYVLRFIARSGLREIFTATALLLVVGIALLMNAVGLSPALGAFVAGVVLSDSEYRHELEGDIEPFKGLLLGLFFISVGASIDFGYVMQNLGLVSLLVLGLIVIKAAVLWVLALTSKSSADQGSLLAMALAQGGEFAFVLVSFCTQQGVLPDEVAKPLVATVALSMAFAPLLFLLHERVLSPRLSATKAVKPEADAIDETSPVIIAGFGRFGNVIGRFLHAQGVKTTVLENDPDHVDLLRRIGLKVFYGDATRLDLLHAAGAAEARLLIVAIKDEEKSMNLIEACRKHFPRLQVLARAYGRDHAYRLIQAGADSFVLEHQGSSLNLGVEALSRLGFRRHAAYRAAMHFKDYDDESVRRMAEVANDRGAYIETARIGIADLEERMKAERAGAVKGIDVDWDDSTLRQGF
jgi:monovalent cation:proton antiporter-2 (CPA2) family protein